MNRRGFTLVEVLVVVLIVATALVQIVGVFSQESRYIEFSEHETVAHAIAISLAERTVQELARTGYQPVDIEHKAEGAGLAPRNFTYEVRARPEETDPYLWTISVEVSWTIPSERRGAPHRVRLERVVGRADAAFTARFPFRRSTKEVP